MTLDHLLLAFIWIMYGALHSILASVGVKAYVQKNYPGLQKYYRLSYNLFAFAGLGLILWYQLKIPSPDLFERNTLSLATGGIISISGLLLMSVCIKKYFLSLSGLKSFWQEEPRSELIISGVHRFVRHPLYLGTFLFIWGLLGLFPTLSLLISNVVITVYTMIGTSFEERKLVMEFGEQYKTYQETVPKIIPRIPVSENPLHSHRQKNSFGR